MPYRVAFPKSPLGHNSPSNNLANSLALTRNLKDLFLASLWETHCNSSTVNPFDFTYLSRSLVNTSLSTFAINNSERRECFC